MGLFDRKPPEQYYIKDKLLKCHHCDHDLFYKRYTFMNAGVTFKIDWGSRNATYYVCADCNFVHLFMDEQKSRM